MKEGSDREEVQTREGREIKGRGGEARGSVGYPFESWKLFQRADTLMDGQNSLCLFVLSYHPASLHVEDIQQPLETLTVLPHGSTSGKMHNVTTEYTHSPLSHAYNLCNST